MNKENSSMQQQDSPHRDGPNNNIASTGENRANNSTNNARSMSEMMQDSPEQLAGREKNKHNEDDQYDHSQQDKP